MSYAAAKPGINPLVVLLAVPVSLRLPTNTTEHLIVSSTSITANYTFSNPDINKQRCGLLVVAQTSEEIAKVFESSMHHELFKDREETLADWKSNFFWLRQAYALVAEFLFQYPELRRETPFHDTGTYNRITNAEDALSNQDLFVEARFVEAQHWIKASVTSLGKLVKHLEEMGASTTGIELRVLFLRSSHKGTAEMVRAEATRVGSWLNRKIDKFKAPTEEREAVAQRKNQYSICMDLRLHYLLCRFWLLLQQLMGTSKEDAVNCLQEALDLHHRGLTCVENMDDLTKSLQARIRNLEELQRSLRS